MRRWLPSPDEERWLEVAARLRGAIPRDAAAGHTGWRSAGPFARAALFLLGIVATALLIGILGFGIFARSGSSWPLLVAGLAATGVAERLKRGRLLHASGIEEGLCVAGFLAIALWSAEQLEPLLGNFTSDGYWLLLIAAAGGAGLRLLNPLVTTGAALGLAAWIGSTAIARAIDGVIGGGMTVLVLSCAAAAIALAAGANVFRRPSHDRMLDWLVVTLPLFGYRQHAYWEWVVMNLPGPSSVASVEVTGRVVAIALLLGLGVASLIAGQRRRRHAPLLAFMVCVACVAIELKLAIGGPTEAWLILYGLGAIGAGVALDRYLRKPRNGMTSAKITDREGPLDLLQTAGAAVLARAGGAEQPPTDSGMKPGGGRYGGGGASGEF